jgi:hypothetical protein
MFFSYTLYVYLSCAPCVFNDLHLLNKEKNSYALNGTRTKLSFSYDNICNEANLMSLLMVNKTEF